MSAEILRRAAAQIRNDRGDVVSRNTQDGRRWLPVADWLDAHAKHAEHAEGLDWPNTWPVEDEDHAALAVARAYLGEES